MTHPAPMNKNPAALLTKFGDNGGSAARVSSTGDQGFEPRNPDSVAASSPLSPTDGAAFRADSIRVMHPLFQTGEGGSIPTSALQLRVHLIDIERACELNRLWHSRLPLYATGFCLTGTAFAAEWENVFYAVAIWSNPVAASLPQDTWMELRRFAIAADRPPNTASRMLAVMTRLIRRDRPEVETLISYQDIESHSGTIYRAAGWRSDAEHSGGSWNRPNSRNACGTPRMRPDSNGATGPKARWRRDLRGAAA